MEAANPSSSSLLDNPSSNTHEPVPSYREVCLSGWNQTEMHAVTAFYESLDNRFAANRLSGCRSNAWFARNKADGIVKILAKSCHVRFCPLCGKSRRYAIERNTTRWLKACKFPKMLTLTLKHSDESLWDLLRRLYTAFKALRRLKLWKSTVTGGIWFFELTLNAREEWHPHLHVLIEGKYLPHRALCRAWEQETGDSYIVDIRAVKDDASAAEYVAKYAVKPISMYLIPENLYLEYYTGISKRRFCGAFGVAKESGVLTRDKITKEGWTRIGSWSTIWHESKSNADAAEIILAYKTNKPISEGITLIDIDNFIDNTNFEEAIISEKIDDEYLFY